MARRPTSFISIGCSLRVLIVLRSHVLLPLSFGDGSGEPDATGPSVGLYAILTPDHIRWHASTNRRLWLVTVRPFIYDICDSYSVWYDGCNSTRRIQIRTRSPADERATPGLGVLPK